jgi:oligopeptide/dipeptide ABC transporter ATP-binding protein
MSAQGDMMVEVKGLKKYFPIKAGVIRKTVGHVKAVDGVSFQIGRGEVLGLVGESGCGKTTIGRTLLRLCEATEGDVRINGRDVFDQKKQALRRMRQDMQIIFQDPYSSLNPRLTVGEIVGEALMEHKIVRTHKEMNDRVTEMLSKCGLNDYHIKRYPHEFSGGQRQRICIARALVLNPRFVVCDEAVSALDVSIQSQIINLLQDLQEEMGLTYLFISHDLGVVRYISDRIAVMYLGKIVELADKHELFDNPMHPYTKALLSAIPKTDPDKRRARIVLEGDIPSAAKPPSGCRFHTRCPYATDLCSQTEPELVDQGGNHFVACLRLGEI